VLTRDKKGASFSVLAFVIFISMAQPTSGRSDSPWSLVLRMAVLGPITLPELAQDGLRE